MTRRRMTVIDTVLIVVVAVVLALYLMALSIPANADGFGVIEGRAYTPLNDLESVELGAGAALQLCVIPEDLWLVGPFLGNHKLFIDGVMIDGQWAGGGSISLKKADADNGWRAFMVGWRERGSERQFDGAFGIAYGWELDLSNL